MNSPAHIPAALLQAAVDMKAGGAGADELPLFAPGPGNLEAWRRLLEAEPGLEPALPGTADGMADRLDRQRLAGNGVVPLAAAHAWRTLKAALDTD